MSRKSKRLLKNNSGGPAIEMAIVLPILLMIVMAVVEFGIFFIQKQIAGNAVSATARALEISPTDPNIQIDAYDRGVSFMNLNPTTPDNPNYICAKAFVTKPIKPSNNTTYCSGTTWDTARPASVPANGTYYIGVSTSATKKLFTPISNFLPNIYDNYLVTVAPPVDNIPAGAVMAFDRPDDCLTGSTLASCNCPDGWEKYTLAEGRNIVGMGNSGAPGSTNKVFREKSTNSNGQEKHTMTIAEMPSHRHVYKVGKRNVGGSGNEVLDNDSGSSRNTEYTGGGAAFNVMDPYVALLYCRKCNSGVSPAGKCY